MPTPDIKASKSVSKRARLDGMLRMRPSKRRQLNLKNRVDAIYERIERLKAGIRAKVEHPFRILKRQFGYLKTRYRGLAKNIAQITTLLALGNLWMMCKALHKA